MSAQTSSFAAFTLLKAPLSVFCALALSGCSENDSQLIELRQLREKLSIAEKQAAEAAGAVEAAQQAAAAVSSSTQDMTASAQKLTEAESRIAALEKEVQEARSAAQAATETAAKTSSANKGNAESFREFVKTMERDLLSKTSDLQQSVEQALPTANIQETTVKRLRLPDEIATAFNSAVVFILADASGQQRRLEFPVTAGLDGQWRLPGAADVQRHIASATPAQPAPAPVAAAPAPAPAPMQPQPVAAHVDPHVPAPPSQPVAAVPSSAPIGKQSGGPPTVVIQWDNNPRPAAQAQAPTQAPAAAPVQTPTTAATPVKPAAPAPTVPKAIMPVKQDVQIRFE
jgi:hypothetical protein